MQTLITSVLGNFQVRLPEKVPFLVCSESLWKSFGGLDGSFTLMSTAAAI